MVAYCDPNDLVLGNIPLPGYIDAQQKVQDAADEIDSRIGHIYQTPVSMVESGSVSRPARLFLKRINAHLASGRIILAVASPTENSSLHAYGRSLVREAIEAIGNIVSGDLELTGAALVEGAEINPVGVPLISNVDPESNVEAFYDRIANPTGRLLARPNADSPLW